MKVEDFEAIALPHSQSLFRTALRVIGNRAEAEDIVQETFLQAWRSIERFTPGTNIRAWLYKILFHVVSHHRRKWLKFDCGWNNEDEGRWEDSLVYEAPVEQRLTDEDVIAAFDKIPAQYRAVIMLADVQEFSYKEISSILQIPIGTVMSRLNRGRKILAEELKDFAKSYGIERGRTIAEKKEREEASAGINFMSVAFNQL
jgi:RNA polymerase sigma-70 factor (ECF subfamily)